MKEFLISKDKFVRVLDYMTRVGLDPELAIGVMDMTSKQFYALPTDRGLPGASYSRMYKEAVRQMQTLRRPIPWAAGIGSEAFSLMCYSIISCKTLGEALQRAQRFDALLFPLLAYRMKQEVDSQQAHLVYEVRPETSSDVFAPEEWDRSEYIDPVAKASGLIIWYAFCGWLIGRSIDLGQAQVGAAYVNDAYRDRLLKVFHCPLQFEAEDTRISFPLDYLDRRLVQTPESLEQFLDNAIYELIILTDKPASTSGAIRSLISIDFSAGMPSFEQIADNLHMSESSLRRRLLKEETSYQELKDQVRCEVAVDYLSNDDIKISDLSGKLGFTEPSSFVRSFRSWTGVTPRAYRDNMKALSA